MLPTIIISAPQEVARSEIERQVIAQHKAWHEQYRDLVDPLTLPENVRFAHDPEWRSRFISISAAREAQHPVWMAVRVLFVVGGLIFTGFSILRPF